MRKDNLSVMQSDTVTRDINSRINDIHVDSNTSLHNAFEYSICGRYCPLFRAMFYWLFNEFPLLHEAFINLTKVYCQRDVCREYT